MWRVTASSFASACKRVGVEEFQVDASFVGYGDFSPDVMRYLVKDDGEPLDPPEDFR